MKRSVETRTIFIPGWAIGLVSLSMVALLWSQFLQYENVIRDNGDIAAYQRTAISINALRSGVHVEAPSYYPPLANLLFLSAENNVLHLPFHRALLALFICSGLAACAFISFRLGDKELRWVVLAVPTAIVLLEPAVFFARFDFFPMLCILLSTLSMRKKDGFSAGIFLALGCLLKLAPAFLFPVFFFLLPSTQERRKLLLGMTLSAAGVIAASFFMIGVGITIESVLSFAKLRTSYPPYALSTASSIDLFFRMITGGKGIITWVAPDLGHFNTGLPVWLSGILLFLSAIGVAGISLIAARSPKKKEAALLYATATLLWLLVSTPLLTMHYYLWVLPLPLLWFLERTEKTWRIRPWQGVVGIGTILLAILGQWTYPTLYFDLVDHQTTLAVSVNALRNMLAFGLVIASLMAIRELGKR